jgi:hypothetical protein
VADAVFLNHRYRYSTTATNEGHTGLTGNGRSLSSSRRDDQHVRCEGFLVDGPRGRLGVVTEVRFHSRHDRPDELVVHAGLLGNRVSIVPVSEVVAVVPRQARILTSASRRQPALDRLARLRVYLQTTIAGR